MTHSIDIGSSRELFIDDYLIDRLRGAALKRHAHRFFSRYFETGGEEKVRDRR